MRKIKILLTLIIGGFGFGLTAQNVTIPDANFKAYLVGNAAINTNSDTEIQVSEAAAYSGTIYCIGLGISDLTGIEAFTSLASLNCANNNISNLDVSSNTSLNYLFCTANNLSVIDVSSNLALTHLHCALNNLTVLDVSNNSALISLQCDRNSLTELDVSTNTALTEVWSFSNNLSSLNVANGNNTNITPYGFDATNNPNLSCIKVDDAAYSTTNWANIDAQTSFSETVCCAVTIPDANFKAYLVGNSAINTDADTEISCAEAVAYNGAINCNGLNISDLTGIEAFTALTVLNCQTNNLTSLDVSNNTALTDLNTSSNSIGSLDVSSNTALINLSCQSNGLDTIDVSNNTDLVFFYCNNNNLENLDVSNNTDITRLYCYSNALSTLDVTNNINLIRLWCHTNSLTSLDLSNASALDRFYCYSNSLTSLNVANGNNSNMSGANFIASANPNLNCIVVDDAAYSNASWSNIDPQTSFSETSCCLVNIPDANFKAYLVGNGAINTDSDSEISCSEAASFTGLIDCSNLTISDLTGIESFTDLTELRCFSNNLDSLDVSNNTALIDLRCNNNNLDSLDVSNNTDLELLLCHSNNLNSLDVSSNISLVEFFCSGNNLTSLDVSNNTALTGLQCVSNNLTSIDVSNNTALIDFRCYGNDLTSLDVSNNTNLTLLQCALNNLSSLDVSNNTVLIQLWCQSNNLTNLNVANGNNSNMSGLNFITTSNPNLNCVIVDDVAYSNANWTSIDAGTNFTAGALPVVEAGMSQTVCDGEMVTLSGSGVLSYQWDNGVTDNISFAASLGTTTYTVIGTNADGCTDTDTVDVIANPLPDNTTSTSGFTIKANET